MAEHIAADRNDQKHLKQERSLTEPTDLIGGSDGRVQSDERAFLTRLVRQCRRNVGLHLRRKAKRICLFSLVPLLARKLQHSLHCVSWMKAHSFPKSDLGGITPYFADNFK